MSISFLGSQKAESGVIATSRPVIVDTGGGNTNGIWYLSIAATAIPAAWIAITLTRSTASVDYLVDIGIGGSGSETVIIADLPYMQNTANSQGAASFLFPLFIPAGSRIAARAQSSGAVSAVDVGITLFAPMFGGELGLGQVETCGAVTATSLGTSVDPGGVAHTKGTWAPLITSTAFAYRWVCLSCNHTNALASITGWLVDIGVGAGGVETVVVPNLVIFNSNTADTNPAIGLCFPLSIPAGTRVSVRCQSSNITSPDRLLEVVLHGVG